MADPAEKHASYADIEALPPNVVGEIIFGSLVTHPRPVQWHGAAAGALNVALGAPYQFGSGGPGGWVFIPEPELHLGPHVIVPDLGGWLRERMTEPPSKGWHEVAPDWVCEILSPGTERHDKGAKRTIYATYGVNHLWQVDPRLKSLEVFRRQDNGWLLTGTFFENDDVNAEPFTELTFPLGRLWPLDPPSTPAT
ncbi:MAG: Uma2 family endonuclease [Hyphomicrobiaceae bacterium]